MIGKIFDNNEIFDIINKYDLGISTEKIGIDYNISPNVIVNLLKRNFIEIRGNKKNIDNQEVIDMYLLDNLKMSDICYKLGVSKHKIRTILKNNNIKSKSSKKYNYYDDIFEKIDSEESAYWLGFLYADGYVRLRVGVGSELRLKLSIVDKEHLLKFKEFISPDDIPVVYEEYKKSKSYKVSINSNKIVSDLIKHGCVNKKSKIIEFPNINVELYSHFIRGYFDGDGSVSHGRNITINMISGSFSFLERVSYELNKNCNCKMANLVGKSTNYKYIAYNTKDDINKLYNYLFSNANCYMDRKKDMFLFIVNNFEKLNNIKNIKRREYNKEKIREKI